MRKTDRGVPSVPVVEVMLTASTQLGALCGRDAAFGYWRKSIHAFSTTLRALALSSVVCGKPLLNASCASAVDVVPIRQKSATKRATIWSRIVC